MVVLRYISGRSGGWLRAALCLLLAVLFLYNPFLAAHCSGVTPTVCHPASHRATVGASELEQFAPPSAQSSVLAPAPQSLVFELLLPISFEPSVSCHRFPQNAAPAELTGFSSSLWFRPPPVR